MKIHKVLTDAIELACKEILENNSHASFVIAQTISKDKRFGSRDRRFMAETISFVLKNYRLLSFLTKQNWEEPKQFSPIVACAIWLENNELPKFYSSTILTDEIAELQSKKKSVSVDFSFPDWMNDLLEKDLGSKKWELEAKHSLDKAFTFLRVNTQKSTLEKCVAFFETAGISHEIVKEVNNCLVLLQRVDITKSEAFINGWFEVQDAGSQMIGFFLNPQKNERIIDACAGAGGKTLHIADLMQNTGKISAMDVEKKKLKVLESRVLRNGYTSIKTHVHQNITLNNYAEWADKLLLDVPCSGLGVLKRNPDDKWKLTPERLQELMQTQEEILQNYSKMLRLNGTLVYATCSMYSGENQQQIKKFLTNNTNFELIEEKQLFPSDGFDGFYMAKLIKK